MDAKCGQHPDRDADGGTCGRCGTYVCAECVVAEASPALCVTCLAHLDKGPNLRHARILSVLMMIHGGLLAAMGAYYVLFGGFILDALADIPTAENAEPGTEMLPEVMVGAFALIGFTQLMPGILQLIAGWQLFKYRGVIACWIAVLAGLVSVFGCYCAPTAFALAGYAAYVLTREDVRARFAVGVRPAQIKAQP